jgi:hypothetical protein
MPAAFRSSAGRDAPPTPLEQSMTDPNSMGSGPLGQTPDSHGLPQPSSAPMPPMNEPLHKKKGVVVAVLVVLNVLCIVAIAAVSVKSPKGDDAAKPEAQQDSKTATATSTASAQAVAAPTPEEPPKPEAAPSAPEPSATRGVVVVPPGKTRGVLHTKPSMTSPMASMIRAGSAIEVLDKSTVKGQTWYHVKTIDKPHKTGWLHEKLVKLK